MFPFNLLSITLADTMFGVRNVPLIGSPIIAVKTPNAKWF